MPAKFSVSAGLLALAIVVVAASGCSSQAEDFVTKIRAESTEKCNQGNQAACHTIVQALSDTKVAIESTAPIETQTPACNAGKQDACQQMAVLHGELSAWCSTGNDAGLRRGEHRSVAGEMGRAGADRRGQAVVPQRPVQAGLEHLPGFADDVAVSCRSSKPSEIIISCSD